MTNVVRTQILAVRDTGETNMFAVNAVQRIAYDNDMYELVTYLEDKDNQKEYANFILYGDSDSLIPDEDAEGESESESAGEGEAYDAESYGEQYV